MPKFTVEKVLGEPREWESRNGTMLTYKIWGSLDGAPAEMVQINTSKAKAKVPAVGEEIECEITKDDPQYGKTIKRVSTGFGGGFTPHAGGGRDPETQHMIVRQNALSNAVAFFTAKATIEKKTESLTTENILMVATKFAAFSIGELKPKAISPVDPNQETMPIEPTVDPSDEIDIDNIPPF